MNLIKCAGCNKDFIPYRKKNIYCCKQCRYSIYYLKHKNDILEKNKLYYNKNTLNIKTYLNNYQKTYYLINKTALDKKHKEYNIKNIDSIKKYYIKRKPFINTYIRNKIKNDSNFRLKRNLRNRLYKTVKNLYKKENTKELLGCSIEYLKIHLEKQFQPGMNWDNYGVYGWHVDHIKPCFLFNMNDIDEQKKCFHYTNLQPLWAKDNLVKNKSYTKV